MNTDNLLIEEKDIELAQDVCRTIEEQTVRNRSVANVIAAKTAFRFFENENNELDIESGLHNIANVLEDIDISDVYLKGCYIDVRLCFDENELLIPKSHFDNNLLPAAYMFIKITSDLSSAMVMGFILPEAINTSEDFDGFYRIKEDELVSFYDIEGNIVSVEDTYAIEKEQILDYLDNRIEDKAAFYRELLLSREGRMELAATAKAQYIFNFVSVVESSNKEPVENQDDLEILNPDTSENDFLMEDDSEVSFDIDEDHSLDIGLESFEEENAIDSDVDLADDLLMEEQEGVQADSLLEEENPLDELFELPEAQAEENIEESEDSFNELDLIEDSSDVQADSDNLGEDESKNETVLDLFEDKEDSSFEFTTVASPSLGDVENMYVELLDDNTASDEESETEDMLEALEADENKEEQEVISEEATPENIDNEEDPSKQIDTLFEQDVNDEEGEESGLENPMEIQAKRSPVRLLLVLGLLVVLGAAGYFGYTKFASPSAIEEESTSNLISETERSQENQPDASSEDAMPVETVETQAVQKTTNEGNSVSIPAIEQNLDASILVSNLRVFWEVPAGYASNTAAGRYLQKLGKIINLNLKTELLLLNKPPITNKIGVEIKFNNSTRKFETVGVVTSSGEKSVDDLILQTVNKVLNMNLNMNTDAFNKLQGNPVLIIQL